MNFLYSKSLSYREWRTTNYLPKTFSGKNMYSCLNQFVVNRRMYPMLFLLSGFKWLQQAVNTVCFKVLSTELYVYIILIFYIMLKYNVTSCLSGHISGPTVLCMIWRPCFTMLHFTSSPIIYSFLILASILLFIAFCVTLMF